MKSFATPRFWKAFEDLPSETKRKAINQYRIWSENPSHPSLHFKKVGANIWSARISQAYRALALEKEGDFCWFWIGNHRQYETIIRK
jgi:hypothetical protein